MLNRLFLFVAITCAGNASLSQIVLEHSYPGITGINGNDFGLTKLDNSTYKYYKINYNISEFTLYNLDHSVYETVTLPVIYDDNNYKIQHITLSLFDCDSTNIEYMLIYDDNNWPNEVEYVKVFRTDGTELFFADSSLAITCVGCANIWKNYITNTPNGTKMILHHSAGYFNVYSLCGVVPTYMQENEIELLGIAYPNPVVDRITLPYELTPADNSGTLNVYDPQGTKICSFKVDKTFNSIELNTSDLPAGIYTYTVITEGHKTASKKFIKIN